MVYYITSYIHQQAGGRWSKYIKKLGDEGTTRAFRLPRERGV